MKKLTLILIATVTVFCFYACNNGEEKKQEPKAETAEASNTETDSSKKTIETLPTCTGIENLLITTDSARTMMARFDSIYKKIKTSNPLTYLKNWEWIDAMIINSYANFFETNAGKAYDGVRFVHAATNDHTDTRILLVPTKPGGSSHTDVWGTGIISPETGDPTEYKDWETNPNVANTLKDNFYTIYRRARGLPRDKDPLSESVWMSNCVFIYLRDQIKKPENQIDGIRIYMGAYGKMMGAALGQIHTNQSTILLVPTSNGGSKVHNDRWDLLRPGQALKTVDALNHGELCPTKCN